ncbi:hypothetical protein CCACVL1_05125 [Corchorus capsularis]|uniref:Uncharacterized protein n=1 Tax=Corchorus capsularis TaxID=210143 RepID=A0A1R3JMF0_COCAP|nr:hypothetical protein CCACVL1_05125 [Corchorus capsularis]
MTLGRSNGKTEMGNSLASY